MPDSETSEENNKKNKFFILVNPNKILDNQVQQALMMQ